MQRSFSLWMLLPFFLSLYGGGGEGTVTEKIGGVSVVSPASRVDATWAEPVRQINAEWVAIMPYAFGRKGASVVRYNNSGQWWGERFEGMRELIRHAHEKGLKVMLKPMVWVSGSWAGDVQFDDEAGWKAWEAEYTRYILESAQIAKAEGVEMFCLGTELKISVREREGYWRALCKAVRHVYDGPVTYAANWDNFMKVKFWDALDYIGVDAYFPLSEKSTASVTELKRHWAVPVRTLQTMHKVYRKPILFTEFGYRSLDRCTWKQWEIQDVPYHQQVNLKAQEYAYQAFFESLWEKEWFAGVFLWQWYTDDAQAGGPKNSDYTPQNKPAESLISAWFEKSSL